MQHASRGQPATDDVPGRVFVQGICPLFLEWSFSELGDASHLQDKLLYLQFVNVDTYTERMCWAERNRWTEDHISFYHS